MKKIIVIVSLMLGCNAFAQIEIKDQPGDSYFESLKEWGTGKTPAQKDLISMKPAPVTFTMDTLKKYDWLQVGSYSYTDKDYTDDFAPDVFVNGNEKQYQLRTFRILGDGTKADFSVNKFKTKSSSVTTTSFEKNTSQVYKGIKAVKGISFIESSIYGSSEFLKVVSYKNGVLIVDISISGKVTAPVRFRNVYAAIPKKFDWDFGK